MSLYPTHKPYAEVNDFYESLQSIHNNLDSNENFGKRVSQNTKGVRKTFSHKNLAGMNPREEGNNQSFSTNSFQATNCEMPNFYAKMSFGYKYEDPSTKGSLSSSNSLNSCTNMASASSFINIPNVCSQNTKTCINTSNSSSNLNQNSAGLKATTGKAKAVKGNRKRSGTETSFRQKYKTEVCKLWAEKGHCKFGDQCAFAHGNDEMRQKQHLSNNYKTKKCHQFHETGYCPYGIRCQFVHTVGKDANVCPSSFDQNKYVEALENAELWITHDPDCMCLQKKIRPRLPSFQSISLCSTSDDDCCHDKESNSSSENSLEHACELMFL